MNLRSLHPVAWRPLLFACAMASLKTTARIASAAPPIAAHDAYSLDQDAELVVTAAQGLMANDTSFGQAVSAVVVQPPATGSLSLNEDGSFRFTPAPGATGRVSFTYQLRTVPGPVAFTIDPARSRLQVEARATTDYGDASDRDETGVTGTLSARLTPSTAPFLTAQIISLDARLTDQLNLSLRFGCLFNLCLATVTVTTRTTAPDSLSLVMTEPGPAVPVVSGQFTQLNNTFALAGIVDIAGTGLAADLIPSGPLPLDTAATIDLTQTRITATATTITLRTPVLYSGRTYLDPEITTTNYIDLTARSEFTGSSGFLVATAPASSNVPEQSDIATVTLNIVSLDADNDGMPDRWELANGLDPEDPSDAREDTDGDGADNRSEFLAGTDPRLASSRLALATITISASNLTIAIAGLTPGLSYQMETSASLSTWSSVGEPFTATQSAQSLSLPTPAAPRFFQLRCLHTWP